MELSKYAKLLLPLDTYLYVLPFLVTSTAFAPIFCRRVAVSFTSTGSQNYLETQRGIAH